MYALCLEDCYNSRLHLLLVVKIENVSHVGCNAVCRPIIHPGPAVNQRSDTGCEQPLSHVYFSSTSPLSSALLTYIMNESMKYTCQKPHKVSPQQSEINMLSIRVTPCSTAVFKWRPEVFLWYYIWSTTEEVHVVLTLLQLCAVPFCVCVYESTFYSSCGDEGGRTNSPGTSSSGQNRDAAQRKTREEGLLPVVRLQRPSNKKVQDFTIATDPRSNRLWMKTALDVVHGI